MKPERLGKPGVSEGYSQILVNIPYTPARRAGFPSLFIFIFSDNGKLVSMVSKRVKRSGFWGFFVLINW